MKGDILFWYDWEGTEAQLLTELIEKYTELIPEVNVIGFPVSADTIVARFEDRSASGLGPDLLLLNSSLAYELAQKNLLSDISGQIELDEEQYVSEARSTVQDGNSLYGLPFSMHSQVLYYNKLLTESPPDTLEELQDRIADGESIALDTNLVNAIWGAHLAV